MVRLRKRVNVRVDLDHGTRRLYLGLCSLLFVNVRKLILMRLWNTCNMRRWTMLRLLVRKLRHFAEVCLVRSWRIPAWWKIFVRRLMKRIKFVTLIRGVPRRFRLLVGLDCLLYVLLLVCLACRTLLNTLVRMNRFKLMAPAWKPWNLQLYGLLWFASWVTGVALRPMYGRLLVQELDKFKLVDHCKYR